MTVITNEQRAWDDPFYYNSWAVFCEQDRMSVVARAERSLFTVESLQDYYLARIDVNQRINPKSFSYLILVKWPVIANAGMCLHVTVEQD